jgi:hypothetical protein
MLKPYVFVACEKVIIAKDEVASLIGLFSKIILTVPPGTDISANAVTPKEWAVFSIWEVEPGDEKREYILCTQILYPDQSPYGEINRHKIRIEPNKRTQVTLQFNGMPIGQMGLYSVRSWIEEKQEKVFGPLEFKIEVEMNRQEKPS